jgi:N-acetylmuramoyl-L-alanine amidase
MAKQLHGKAKENTGFKLILTLDNDELIEFEKRKNMVNDLKADLIILLRINSNNDREFS